MKEEQILSKKRNRVRSPIVVGVVALGVLILFFAAPIIPVEGNYTISNNFCGNNFHYSYTDWQSPSYHLLNVGYHRVFPHTFCQ